MFQLKMGLKAVPSGAQMTEEPLQTLLVPACAARVR